MPKTFPFIQIRFLQNNATASEDHRLDIKRSNGCYLWVYRCPDLPHTETITLKNREELFERLEIMTDLLGIDEDPHDYFQVFVPGMPTVLAGIKRFQATLGILQRAIDATIERWPIRAPWEEVNGRLDQDNCQDVDSEYSEEDEDEGENDEDDESEDEEQADPAPDRQSSWVSFVTAWHNMMPEGTSFTESMRQAAEAWRAARGESQAREDEAWRSAHANTIEDGETSDSDSDSTDSEMPPLVSNTRLETPRNSGSSRCPVAPPRCERRLTREDPEGTEDREIRMTRNGPRVHLRF